MDNRNIIQNAALIAVILLLMVVSNVGATIELSVETKINPEGTEGDVWLEFP